jgi:serine/threonine protein kinase
MAYLHSHGIMHRSLAPKNVLLDNTLTARVRDYGLAAVKDDIWSTQRASNPRFPLYLNFYSVFIISSYFHHLFFYKVFICFIFTILIFIYIKIPYCDLVKIRFSVRCTRIDERVPIHNAGISAIFNHNFLPNFLPHFTPFFFCQFLSKFIVPKFLPKICPNLPKLSITQFSRFSPFLRTISPIEFM